VVPNARFTELLADIEPSSTTTANAAAAHTGIRDHLRQHATFKDRWVTDFLAGSYARDTAVRPQSNGDSQDRPDVDIIVVTKHSTSDAPEDVLAELRKAVEDDGDGYEVTRTNKRSVRVETWRADMDIVPLIETWNGGYLIPDRETGNWLATNPPVHTQWSIDQNTAFGGRFKKLVKLFKWWRRQNPTGKRPKGFVLEVLVANHAPKNETHFGEAFTVLLENIYKAHGRWAELGVKPTISDPAVLGNDILAKVTVAQWRDFIEKIRVHADYARRAQNEKEDMEKATELWRKVFGSRFKATPNVAKAATATTMAAAAVPASGYTFPNTPATPNKPRGFA